jgi:hypothetical protein
VVKEPSQVVESEVPPSLSNLQEQGDAEKSGFSIRLLQMERKPSLVSEDSEDVINESDHESSPRPFFSASGPSRRQ